MAVYTPRRKPWAHQKEALDKMGDREAFALFMGMRTGKTKTTLDNWGRLELEGKVHDLLVVAPGGVYRTWEKALWGDPSEPGDLGHLSDDLRGRLVSFTWSSGMNKTRQRELQRFICEPSDKPRALLMNVEALSSVKDAKEISVAFAKARKCMGVVDESTIIKNPQSKRTQFINVDLANELDFRRILSGLPNPRSPLDYYAQFEFLDWRLLGFRNFYSFRARYAEIKDLPFGPKFINKEGKEKRRTVKVVKGYRNLDDLKSRIDPHCVRVSLRDCYDVPEKMYIMRDVELTPEQRRIYDEMKKWATAQLDEMSHVTATVVIAQIVRLSQILCGHVPDEEGKMHEIPENKTQHVMDILEEYDGKAIIWCAYSQDVEKLGKAIAKEYGEEAVARFWGGNQDTRENEEARFKGDPACRFMVATAAAGGRGRTWDVADLTIYHSNTEDLEHRDQSEVRTDGVGKFKPVTVIDLVCRGTVEEKKIKCLRAKIDLASAVNGEGYRAWLI